MEDLTFILEGRDYRRKFTSLHSPSKLVEEKYHLNWNYLYIEMHSSEVWLYFIEFVSKETRGSSAPSHPDSPWYFSECVCVCMSVRI